VKPWNVGAVIYVNQQHMYCDSILEQKFGCDTGKCCVCVFAAVCGKVWNASSVI
jgi:hypothetical protein